MEEAMIAIAKALDAVPDGTELDAVPDFVRKHVLEHGGTPGAAQLAASLVRAIRKGGRR